MHPPETWLAFIWGLQRAAGIRYPVPQRILYSTLELPGIGNPPKMVGSSSRRSSDVLAASCSCSLGVSWHTTAMRTTNISATSTLPATLPRVHHWKLRRGVLETLQPMHCLRLQHTWRPQKHGRDETFRPATIIGTTSTPSPPLPLAFSTFQDVWTLPPDEYV